MRVVLLAGLMGCTGDQGTGMTIPTGSPRGDEVIDARPLLEALPGLWRDFKTGGGELDLAVTEDGWVFGRGLVASGGTRRLRFGLSSDGAHLQDTSTLEGSPVNHTASVVWDGGTVWSLCGESGCDDLQVDLSVDDKILVITTFVGDDKPDYRFDGQKLEEVPGGELTLHEPDDADPVLPTLTVEASWLEVETVATWARVVVARGPCQTLCVPSRTFDQLVPSGQLSTTFEIPELHPGVYYVTAFLDRNRNANGSTSYRPDEADAFELPDRKVIVTTDQTVSVRLTNQL